MDLSNNYEPLGQKGTATRESDFAGFAAASKLRIFDNFSMFLKRSCKHKWSQRAKNV